MLADALLVGLHSGRSETLGISEIVDRVTSVMIQVYDNRGLVLLCVYVFSILWTCIDFLKYYGVLYICCPKCFLCAPGIAHSGRDHSLKYFPSDLPRGTTMRWVYINLSKYFDLLQHWPSRNWINPCRLQRLQAKNLKHLAVPATTCTSWEKNLHYKFIPHKQFKPLFSEEIAWRNRSK
jgi:hypothetical protein